ncbi:putative transcription elongation factor SPT5 -like protein 1, partial [Capsicum annuum]
MKGDRVIVVKGDLRDRKGRVEKVEEDTIHIRPNEKDLPMETLAFSDKELRKYFEVGDHVKVISGSSEGVIGMVESVEGHVVSLISNTTKERLCVFTDNVVQSSEVTSSLTRFGEYELRDLVKLDNKNFGVIIRVDGEVFQVLKGVPDRPEVALVRLREIKEKVEKKGYAQDHFNNQLTVKDVVKVIEGPCKRKQGSVEHIFNGIVFINDRQQFEHAGFICAKTRSLGNPFSSRSACLTTPSRVPQSPMRSSIGGLHGGSHRDGRGHGTLVGADVKIRLGPFKGCKGRVRNIKGTSVFVELEAQMKVVPGKFFFNLDALLLFFLLGLGGGLSQNCCNGKMLGTIGKTETLILGVQARYISRLVLVQGYIKQPLLVLVVSTLLAIRLMIIPLML